MSILAHAQENQVQNRLAGAISRRQPAKFLRGFHRGGFGWILAVNSMDLVVGQFERFE